MCNFNLCICFHKFNFYCWVSVFSLQQHSCLLKCSVQFSHSVVSDSLQPHELTAAHQAFLSITNSQTLFKLMSIESVMPSNHLILCHPLLLPTSIFPNIRVFSNESVLPIRWAKYWSFSFNISPLAFLNVQLNVRCMHLIAAMKLKDVYSLEEKLWPT